MIRFNAIPVLTMPSLCRLVVCGIGGTAEVRGAVEAARVNVLAARSRAGVLAFGSDSGVRSAFGPFGIEEFDLHTIYAKRLVYESTERGLLRAALTLALQRERGLIIVRRSVSHLLAPSNPEAPEWTTLKKLVGPIKGQVPSCAEVTWREGVGLRLEWAHDQLWLVFEPRTVFDGVTEETKPLAADFARERTVKRYNRALHDLIAFWSKYLSGGERDLRALGIADGVDAVFTLGETTAYSYRGGA